MPTRSATTYTVALLGFSEFERTALTSYFRLAQGRATQYLLVPQLSAADFVIADADHAASVQLVTAIERLGATVFIGLNAPAGSVAWMQRPIDALHVTRELDAMVSLDGRPAAAAANEAQKPRPMAGPAPGQSPIEEASGAVALSPGPPLPPRPRALLVDDSEVALRYLELRLRRFGLVTDLAADSKTALELLAQHNHDFVFLDVELGQASELDGLALCRHIKHLAATLQSVVVMLSAHHREIDRVRGALAGCDAYLAKPLNENELERLLLRHGLKVVVADPALELARAALLAAAGGTPQ